jgi:excisionase family DNA binding protein
LPSPPTLLTETEAAEHLRISTRTVRKFRQSGALPHVRLGRSIRYVVDDINALVSQLTVSNDTDVKSTISRRSLSRSNSSIVPFSQRQNR